MNDSVYCYCCEYWQESTGCINPKCCLDPECEFYDNDDNNDDGETCYDCDKEIRRKGK
jgi:hypothetical protein